MKYRIEGTYYRKENSPLISAWYDQRLEHDGNLSLIEWLKDNTGCSDVYGNWEDGWTLTFLNQKAYTVFLIKWSDETDNVWS